MLPQTIGTVAGAGRALGLADLLIAGLNAKPSAAGPNLQSLPGGLTAGADSSFLQLLKSPSAKPADDTPTPQRTYHCKLLDRDFDVSPSFVQALAAVFEKIAAAPTASAPVRTDSAAPAVPVDIERLKSTLQKLWLQDDGTQAIAQLAAFAMPAVSAFQAPAAEAATTRPASGASGTQAVPNLDSQSGLDLLVDFLKLLDTPATPDGGATTSTGVLASLKDRLKDLGTVVMDAVRQYLDAQNGQPPEVVYLADSVAQADAPDADVRLVGLNTSKEEVVASLQTLVDHLESEAVPAERRQEAAPAATGHVASSDHAIPGVSAVADNRSARSDVAPDPSRAANVAQPSRLTDSVRQVRAAMADMLDRMGGNVTFDSDRMRAVLQLDPPAMGRVHVDLRVDGAQRVHATFHADDSATQDFLRQNQSDLRREFERQGYNARNVEIAFDDDDARAFAELTTSVRPVA